MENVTQSTLYKAEDVLTFSQYKLKQSLFLQQQMNIEKRPDYTHPKFIFQYYLQYLNMLNLCELSTKISIDFNFEIDFWNHDSEEEKNKRKNIFPKQELEINMIVYNYINDNKNS